MKNISAVDSVTRQVSFEEVSRSCAYILFYEREWRRMKGMKKNEDNEIAYYDKEVIPTFSSMRGMK